MTFFPRLKVASLLTLIGMLLAPLHLYADTIAIIGTGQVAGALGPEFASQGHTIVYGSRNPDRDDVKALVNRSGTNASVTSSSSAVVEADIVVLAVPGELVETITRSLGDLSGKIIIDPTNPLRRMRMDCSKWQWTLPTVKLFRRPHLQHLL